MQVHSREKSSYNFYRILRAIWHNKGVSRAELARMFHLDKSTISAIVAELVDKGIVREIKTTNNSDKPGRKPIGLEIDKDSGRVLGVHIRPNGFTLALTDMQGDSIKTIEVPILTYESNLIDNCYNVLASITHDPELKEGNIVGVGFALSGIVDHHKGMIYESIPFHIGRTLQFADELERRLPYPVFIDNDANACAWGVLASRKDNSLRNMLFVLSYLHDDPSETKWEDGIGIGMSFVMNGKVYYGDDHSAGEFRSVFWEPKSNGQFSLSPAESLSVTLVRGFLWVNKC